MTAEIRRAMTSVINRLRSDDGSFDVAASFAIGILGEHVAVSGHELLTLMNKQVEVTFETAGESKIQTMKALKASWPHPEGFVRGLKELKDAIEGQTIVVALDVANDIKAKCGGLACVAIS